MDAAALLLPETLTPEDRDRADDIRANPDMQRALTMGMDRRSFTKHPDITHHRLLSMAPVITVLDITARDGVGEDGGKNRDAPPLRSTLKASWATPCSPRARASVG
jgi:hypothetical protein